MKLEVAKQPLIIAALILVQTVCAGFFLYDVLIDQATLADTPTEKIYLVFETVAALSLLAAIFFEARVLRSLLRRKSHLERQVSLAARAFHDVIEERFAGWGFTPAERDVAHFTVKGLAIAEIAGLRGSAEGTVKSQLNAIYRKAEVGSRGEFLSLLIEDLMTTGPE
ncbi:helix-turn-helix transcriptional regulator [Nioella nitratireducens]|uniref:helix-turn-helix transcriptional regulator n=1 Tax=Nioella nitratireducens TaxID=1287720 RepID=UPI0008FD5DEF|nr:LuxR C-terminal-related transcriptional regulator [Nioella nitratireducens]